MGPVASRKQRPVIRAGLEALYFSGAHFLMRPLVGGAGVILALRHVKPARFDPFQPNRHREVEPSFLDDVIQILRRKRIDIVSLDEMHRRLTERDFRRRFACLTFDGGYRDTKIWAGPILKKYSAPFALFVPTSFPDGIGEMWWLALEQVVARMNRIGLTIDGEDRWFDCGTIEDKQNTFEFLHRWLRGLPADESMRMAMRDLAARYHVDMASIRDQMCLSWAELAELAADPLITIGAHTVNHVILQKVSGSVARSELQMSRSVIEAALGVRPGHFAYPEGDRDAAGPREFKMAAELGYKTAVTGRPGMLFAGHRQHLHALPRISLSGDYQQMRYVSVMLSGAATAFWSGFRHLDVAR